MKFSKYYFLEGFPGFEKALTNMSLDDFVKSEMEDDEGDEIQIEDEDMLDEDIDDAQYQALSTDKFFKSAEDYVRYKEDEEEWLAKKEDFLLSLMQKKGITDDDVIEAIGEPESGTKKDLKKWKTKRENFLKKELKNHGINLTSNFLKLKLDPAPWHKERRGDYDLLDLGQKFKGDDDTLAGKKKLIHGSVFRGFKTGGREMQVQQFIDLITQKPEKFIAQNTKLAKSGVGQVFYDLTMPAYKGLIYDEKSKEFRIIKTCPFADQCKKFCYACKGGYIQYTGPGVSAARMLNYLFNDYEGFKSDVMSQLNKEVEKNKKDGNKTVLRWHDSGDFMSKKYLELVFDIARATPNVMHYAYTKAVSMVKEKQASGEVPKNFLIIFSVGGLEDSLITGDDKASMVVPKELFKDIPKRKSDEDTTEKDTMKSVYSARNLQELKERISNRYAIDIDRIVSLDELKHKYPKDTAIDNNDNMFHWCVLVWGGHGDDAAARWDVGKVMLFFH